MEMTEINKCWKAKNEEENGKWETASESTVKNLKNGTLGKRPLNKINKKQSKVPEIMHNS